MIYIHNHTLTIIFYAYFRNPNHFVLRNELQEDDSVLFKGENTLPVKNRTKLGWDSSDPLWLSESTRDLLQFDESTRKLTQSVNWVNQVSP